MNNDIRNLSKWLNEEQEAPIDRQALARVLAMFQTNKPVAWPVLPDKLVYDGYESPQYIEGWNDCRELMKGMK
jgi:hypothetical protein